MATIRISGNAIDRSRDDVPPFSVDVGSSFALGNASDDLRETVRHVAALVRSVAERPLDELIAAAIASKSEKSGAA
jgi:hypothetical protein